MEISYYNVSGNRFFQKEECKGSVFRERSLRSNQEIMIVNRYLVNNGLLKKGLMDKIVADSLCNPCYSYLCKILNFMNKSMLL